MRINILDTLSVIKSDSVLKSELVTILDKLLLTYTLIRYDQRDRRVALSKSAIVKLKKSEVQELLTTGDTYDGVRLEDKYMMRFELLHELESSIKIPDSVSKYDVYKINDSINFHKFDNLPVIKATVMCQMEVGCAVSTLIALDKRYLDKLIEFRLSTLDGISVDDRLFELKDNFFSRISNKKLKDYIYKLNKVKTTEYEISQIKDR